MIPAAQQQWSSWGYDDISGVVTGVQWVPVRRAAWEPWRHNLSLDTDRRIYLISTASKPQKRCSSGHRELEVEEIVIGFFRHLIISTCQGSESVCHWSQRHRSPAHTCQWCLMMFRIESTILGKCYYHGLFFGESYNFTFRFLWMPVQVVSQNEEETTCLNACW